MNPPDYNACYTQMLHTHGLRVGCQLRHLDETRVHLERRVRTLQEACRRKDEHILRQEEQLLKQARKIQYLQNIIKNMPVVALPGLTRDSPPGPQAESVGAQSIKNFGAEKVETEDGWVAC